MKRAAAYRITADVCLSFSIMSAFPVMRPWLTPMALFAAACLAVSLIAVHLPFWPLRLLLALLPALAFYGAEPNYRLLFPALAWLYLILVLTRGRFHVWLDEYRRSFRTMLFLYVYSFAANVLAHEISPRVPISLPAIQFALCFFCLGTLALRRMQINAKMDLRWSAANFFTVLAAPALAVGCSLLLARLLELLKPGLATAIDLLFRPIGMLIIRLMGLLLPVMTFELPDETELPEPTLDLPAPPAAPQGAYVSGRAVGLNDPVVLAKALHVLAWTALALLLLLAIVLIVRRALRGHRKPEVDEFLYEDAYRSMPSGKGKAGRLPLGSYAGAVRRTYRIYLRLIRKRGVRIRSSSTSGDILEAAGRFGLSPAAERLRELYLKARYGTEASVSHEDALEAQRCLQQIREELKP